MDIHWIYLALLSTCLLSCVQGVLGVIAGWRFLNDVKKAVSRGLSQVNSEGRFTFQPPLAVILPCCGVDEYLHRTVEQLSRQNYEDYEVIFTFESKSDPAYAAVEEWTRGWEAPRHRLVVAGSADARSQKVHNLLAALKQVSADRKVLIFLDSDAVPGDDWLGHMVAPLSDESVGAATGFRWYCANGGIANGVRSVWNAASLTLFEQERTRFCWGGATAILRERFESLRIAERWDRALSDDLQVTKAIKEAELRIVFVPQALIPSHDQTTLRGFWDFAVRQLTITRIGAPRLWWSGFFLCQSFMWGGTVAAVLCLGAAIGLFGSPAILAISAGLWGIISLTTVGRAVLRQSAVKKVLGPPDLTWRDTAWDIGGALLIGIVHQLLFTASMRGRVINWRGRTYEMVSGEETRILRSPGATGGVTHRPAKVVQGP